MYNKGHRMYCLIDLGFSKNRHDKKNLIKNSLLSPDVINKQPKLSLQYKIINWANIKKLSRYRYWPSFSDVGLVFLYWPSL